MENTSQSIVVSHVIHLVLNVQLLETLNVVNARLDFTWRVQSVLLAHLQFLIVQPVQTLTLVPLVNQPISSMEGLVHPVKLDVILVLTPQPVLLVSQENI